MPHHQIRKACDFDEAAVAQMMREFYGMFDDLHFDESRSPKALADLLATPNLGHVWLIEFEGTPAGYLALTYGYSLEFYGRTAWVDEFHVREPFRGQGLGRALLDHVHKECEAQGVRAIFLELDHSNAEAGRLYSQFGYQPRHQFQSHYKMLRTFISILRDQADQSCPIASNVPKCDLSDPLL